jgi:aryl-alcohol dehydrogenase-like predicted oxidoreductase
MELRPLGRTGLQVSVLGFGCGSIGGLMVRGDPAEQRRAIELAIDGGVRYFDTAPSYGDGRSEENLGRVLAELGAKAADVLVGTKVRLDPALAGDTAGAARAIRESLEASLRRLRRERVQLVQLHNRITVAGGDGGLTPEQVLGPVAEGLLAVRRAGLAEHIGITATGDPGAVRRVIEAGIAETAQVFFNVLHPSAGWPGYADPGGPDYSGLIDLAAARGIGVLVIRPLAAGALAVSDVRHPNAGPPGGITGERYEDDLAQARRLQALAAELGLEGPVELALRFALSKAGVSTVLVGFSDAAQLGEALRWVERGPLPAGVIERILALRGA